MSTLVFNEFKNKLALNEINLNTISLKIALMDSSILTLSNLEDYISYSEISSYEVSGTGYTTSGKTLTNLTITKDNVKNKIFLDADDVVWSSSVISAVGALIYVNTTGELVLFEQYSTIEDSNNGSFYHNFNSNGILTIS